MTQRQTVDEQLNEAAELLEGMNSRNDELVKKNTELARQMTFWRDRCQAVEGVVVPIVGEPLPRPIRALLEQLDKVFINRVNVEEHVRSDTVPPTDDGEDDEEDGGQG